MKYVLGLDFETTFIDPVDTSRARITEIGAVLWEPRAKTPDLMMSRLVWDENDPGYVYDPRMLTVCGIAEEPLKKFSVLPGIAFQNLARMIDQADAIVAHNGLGFDKPVMAAEFARKGLAMPGQPWIDSMTDFPYPSHIETRKLTHLCGEHGFLNPFPHRALFDVLAMLRIMSHYDFEKVAERAAMPTIVVRAVVPKPFGPNSDGGAGTNKAKGRGFRFNGENKWWVKHIKQNELEDERKGMAPYKIEQVEL